MKQGGKPLRKESLGCKGRLACCYRSFFRMTITPSRDGNAIVAPCWNNMFYPENKVVVKENIKGAWNSKQFTFQRKLISSGDWSFCKGASCVFDPFHREAKFLDDPDVKDAIALKKHALAYTPKVIVINPSHACNCECYFCFYVFMKHNRMKYRLKGHLLKEIEETLIPSAEAVIISGGEPFFAQESRALIDRLAFNHPNKKISINTNGTLLHEYGLDKIIGHNLYLTITVYGMQARTYEAVTKRNNRDIVFRSIQELIDRRYKRMQLLFLVSEKSFNDSEEFCEFIAGNEGLKGIVRNNRYEGARFWGLMRRLEEKYSSISSRLKFEYQNVSLPRIISRRLYNPIHSFRYLLQR
jgi:sulfatase maturation enzyme AslB (radical SAM superfamily)